MRFIVLIIIASVSGLYSCKSKTKLESFAMLHWSYDDVVNQFTKGNVEYKRKVFAVVQKSDTLVVVSTHPCMPFESLYMFENDTCYFQQMELYCSACSDKMLQYMIDDSAFRFEAVDASNYLSTTDDKSLLRIKQKQDSVGVCSVITIRSREQN